MRWGMMAVTTFKADFMKPKGIQFIEVDGRIKGVRNKIGNSGFHLPAHTSHGEECLPHKLRGIRVMQENPTPIITVQGGCRKMWRDRNRNQVMAKRSAKPPGIGKYAKGSLYATAPTDPLPASIAGQMEFNRQEASIEAIRKAEDRRCRRGVYQSPNVTASNPIHRPLNPKHYARLTSGAIVRIA